MNKAKRCDVRIVSGEPADSDGAAEPGRLAELYINGERIPFVVDLFASFPIDGASELFVSFRPTSFEIDGLSPAIVVEMLKERHDVRTVSNQEHGRTLGDSIRRKEIIEDLRVVSYELHPNDLAVLRDQAKRLVSERAKNATAHQITTRDDGGARTYEPTDT